MDIAAANAKSAVDDRGIVKYESFFARGSAVGIKHLHFFFEQAPRQFAGIRYRCRTTNEPRIAAIEVRNAPQPSQHIAEMAAKHSTVGVEFIDHDVAKIFKKPRPARVMRQDASMQHIRICKDHMALLSDSSAGVGGRIAIIGKNAESVVEPLVEVVKLRK